MDFARVLDTVAGFLEGHGFAYAVIGALGLHAYGHSRATFDLDLATEAAAQAGLLPFLESLGYETLHASASYSNHLHADAAWGRLDFVYVDAETARRLFGSCGAQLTLGQRRAPVPRAEHLAALKVQAIKNDPSRALQDAADVRYLLGLPGIDGDEVRGYFERAGLLEWHERIRQTL